MKVKIENNFHNTSMVLTLKKGYRDISELDYESYSKGEDSFYARRKLRKIKKTLCGNVDCGCVSRVVTLYKTKKNRKKER